MEILTQNGFKPFDGFISQGVSTLIRFDLSNNDTIDCTNDHKFLLSDGITFKEAKDVCVGDVLFPNITILEKEHLWDEIEVFDALNVKDTQSYWTNGVISHNCSILILDEFAFVKDGIAREFYTSVYPAISSSNEAKIIIISTPNGVFNLFHEIYSGAEAGRNEYKHLKVTWRMIPGRTEEWKEKQIKNMGNLQKFNQEFEVEFLGSSNTVISSDAIGFMNTTLEEPIRYDLNERLRIFEFPKDGCKYLLGTDPAKGTGEHDATIHVYRIESFKPVKLWNVATFQSNTTDTFELSSIINRLSIYYNDAIIACENNGEGSTVSQNLWWTFENPNLYNSGNKENEIGIRATKATKPKAVITMKKLIEDGSLIIKDRETAKQLSTFIEKKNGSFESSSGGDDLVSGLYWLCFLITTEYFSEDVDLFKNKEQEDEIWGILSDIDDEHYIDTYNW